MADFRVHRTGINFSCPLRLRLRLLAGDVQRSAILWNNKIPGWIGAKLLQTTRPTEKVSLAITLGGVWGGLFDGHATYGILVGLCALVSRSAMLMWGMMRVVCHSPSSLTILCKNFCLGASRGTLEKQDLAEAKFQVS
jgi:hypothetical protein